MVTGRILTLINDTVCIEGTELVRDLYDYFAARIMRNPA